MIKELKAVIGKEKKVKKGIYFFTNCLGLKVEGNILGDSYSGQKGAGI